MGDAFKSGLGTTVTDGARDVRTDVTNKELEYLSGVTEGSSAASKALVLNSSSKIDTIDMTALKIGGVSMTASASSLNAETLAILIDGSGAPITTGIKGDITVDFDGTITIGTLLADQSGSIVVDIWKDTYANYPPTDADSITASAPLTISTATKSQDATLTGWTLSLSAGDVLRFNVDSVTSIERLTLALKVVKT